MKFSAVLIALAGFAGFAVTANAECTSQPVEKCAVNDTARYSAVVHLQPAAATKFPRCTKQASAWHMERAVKLLANPGSWACTKQSRCSPGPGSVERVRMDYKAPWRTYTGTYGRLNVHFPEEDVVLKVHGVREVHNDLRPRTITERLFRRVIAKLFRAGLLDAGSNIVNTGSWIGDNALPWALMLRELRPTAPGTVYAVDPSVDNVRYMLKIANDNGVRNLCSMVGVFGDKESTLHFSGSIDHLTVDNNEVGKGRSLHSVPLDSLNLTRVALVHLDVEGYEANVLLGGQRLLAEQHPVVITEADRWPLSSPKDIHVERVMAKHGYLATVIPERCGWIEENRNVIWWPGAEVKARAMAIVGLDLARPFVDWMSVE